MWDEEDGFFYDVLRLPNGQAQRLKVRSMVGLLPLCAATAFERRTAGEGPRARGPVRAVPGRSARAFRGHPRPEQARRRGPSPGFDSGRNQAPPRAGEDARRKRVPQPLRHSLAVALSRRSSLRHPCRRPGIPRVLPAGRVRYRHVRRQLELARADLDAGQRPDHPGPAPVLHLLRRWLHRGMPHGLRPANEPLPGGRGDRPPARRNLPERPAMATGPSSEERGSSRKTRTGAITSCSTSISTATTGPASAPAIKLAGRESSPGPCTSSRLSAPEQALAGGKKAYFERSVP